MPSLPLSDREVEVVKLIARGYKYREIADELGLTFETVKTYAARVREKIGVNSKIKVALWAIEQGLVSHGKDGTSKKSC